MFEVIILKGGAQVTVDLSSRTKCKKCPKIIFWAVTKNLKNIPVLRDENGEWYSHFVDCKAADEFRRRNNPGAGDLLDKVYRQNAREGKWIPVVRNISGRWIDHRVYCSGAKRFKDRGYE